MVNIMKKIYYGAFGTSEERLIKKLKKGGILGDGCKFFEPRTVCIDLQRPHMLHIGNYCKVCRGVTILAHDYSRSVVIQYLHDNIGEAGMTWIGDNVFIGMNATILMGAHIGDNSIVGAGAVVSGKYPDNSVIAGNPARVICTIEEFSAKRKSKALDEAALYANSWKMKYGEYPSISKMGNAFSWLYLPHTQETIDQYPNFFKLSGVENQQLKKDFLATKPEFEDFECFLEYCKNSSWK